MKSLGGKLPAEWVDSLARAVAEGRPRDGLTVLPAELDRTGTVLPPKTAGRLTSLALALGISAR